MVKHILGTRRMRQGSQLLDSPYLCLAGEQRHRGITQEATLCFNEDRLIISYIEEAVLQLVNMPFEYYSHQAADATNPMDLSDAEDIYTFDEADDAQREYNNLRLKQAINYIAEEGGQDSPATYMSRVDRIDEALVQLLPQAGNNFDSGLQRTVCAMVQEVLEEYDNAIQEARVPTRSEHGAESYTSAVLEALDRAEDDGSESPTRHARIRTTTAGKTVQRKQAEALAKLQSPSVQSTAAPAVEPLRSRRKDTQDNVDLERSWKYGGSNNNVEQWYRKMPASLPFPETFQMEDWESLKINFDISDYGKQLKAEGKVVETNVPFNHPALQHHKNLHHFESGSRFKLPHGTQQDYDVIKKLASLKQLGKCVNEFNQGNRTEEQASDYAPRIFLGRFSVGKQLSPAPDVQTALRDALSRTPTKSSRSSTVTTPSTTGPKTARVKAALQAAGEARNSSIAAVRELRAKADALEKDMTNTSPSPRREPILPPPLIRHGYSPAGPVPVQPKFRAGAAMRKFGDERKQALAQSPRRESLIDGAPGTPESPFDSKAVPRPASRISRPAKPALKKSTPSPKASTSTSISTAKPTSQVPIPDPTITQKRGRGRPRKGPLPISSTPAVLPSTTPTATTTVPKSHTKPSSKRKRSLGSEYYTPDGKRKKSLGSEEFIPLTKTLRSAFAAPRSATPKRVGFVDVIGSRESESSDDDDDSGGDGGGGYSQRSSAGRTTPGVERQGAGNGNAGGEDGASEVLVAVGKAKAAVAAGRQVKRKVVTETVVETTRKVRRVMPGVEVAKSA
ncbi:hypothetical protein J1614_007487 [Plenodomus biglobosus]|nr:hypothetical protein J1614_007487 [Plenodomus biglobosus]